MLVMLSWLGFLPCSSVDGADVLTAAKAGAGGSPSLMGQVATNNGSPLKAIPWERLADNWKESPSCIPAHSVSVGQIWAEYRSFSKNQPEGKQRAEMSTLPACAKSPAWLLACPWQCMWERWRDLSEQMPLCNPEGSQAGQASSSAHSSNKQHLSPKQFLRAQTTGTTEGCNSHSMSSYSFPWRLCGFNQQ